MPFYEYEHCGSNWTSRNSIDGRDRELCSKCNLRARRLISGFSIGNQTYVAGNLDNVSNATGIKGIETIRDADRAMEQTGTVRVDAYYRPPKPPPPKEITLEELNPYLDGMPLNNEPI